MPSTHSAGWVAHQPRMPVRRSKALRMFHSALTLRRSEVTGSSLLVAGSRTVNSRIPCLSGRLPVAMEVHRMGESIGSSETMDPHAARAFSDASDGSRPRSINRSRIIQSAASSPMNSTGRAGRVSARTAAFAFSASAAAFVSVCHSRRESARPAAAAAFPRRSSRSARRAGSLNSSSRNVRPVSNRARRKRSSACPEARRAPAGMARR